MTTSKFALIDTNVLIYAADSFSPFYQQAKAIRDKGVNGELNLCLCPQVLNEFFATVTNGKRVVNAISQDEALEEIKNIIRRKIF
jgi:predicted nucleic acid-binding protein